MSILHAAAKKIESFLSGPAAADPLYLSNRTVGQKIRFGLLVATSGAALAVAIVLGVSSHFGGRPFGKKGPSPGGQNVAKMLLHLDKDFSRTYSRDVSIVEAAVSDGDQTLTGKVRNETDHLVTLAEIVFDVCNEDGSQIGSVAVRIENIAPKTTRAFRAKLGQAGARSVMARELHSR